MPPAPSDQSAVQQLGIHTNLTAQSGTPVEHQTGLEETEGARQKGMEAAGEEGIRVPHESEGASEAVQSGGVEEDKEGVLSDDGETGSDQPMCGGVCTADNTT